MKKKIAVLFPGIGYTCDKPLLYYTGKLAVARGYKLVKVEYGNFPSGIKENKEKMEAMGIPEGTLPTGWWIGFQVTDADVWEKVKDGTYSMFSIEGEAKRVEVEDEESDQ